ncbi:hypothetical protein [Demequina soli]|uniref:hypothetical protein n=1 Tax=Demequina soli TaxID=1638987 RepID=UPI0009E58FA2|nr:hypothetical protein [Demequina soli]
MDAGDAVARRARNDVGRLNAADVPAVRMVRDLWLGELVRRSQRKVLRIMRECALVRPWWERSPVLVLVAPLVLTWAVVLSSGGAAVLATALIAWAAVAEPRLNRAERRDLALLLRAYRNAAADALDARTDAEIYGWEEKRPGPRRGPGRWLPRLDSNQ